MKRRAPTAALVLLASLIGPSARGDEPRAPRTAALVVVSAPGPTEQRIAELRRTLAEHDTLLDDADVRAVLEGFTPRPDLHGEARAALELARQRMQKLDVEGVRHALGAAWEAASALSPTAEARALLGVTAVRRAALALVERDPPMVRRQLALALSIDPTLTLDPREAAPPLVAALEESRRRRAAAPKVTLSIESDPAAARVMIEGVERGETLRQVTDVPEGPTVVWLSRQGSTPQAAIVDAAAGKPARIALTPLPAARRLGPLVEGLRQATGDRGPAAAALGEELHVDVIWMIGADPAVAPEEHLVHRDPTIIVRAAPTVPPKRWFKRPWVWAVIAGGVVVAGGAIALGLTLGHGGAGGLGCCVQ